MSVTARGFPVIEQYPAWVDAIRCIAYREVRDHGATYITDEWISKKLFNRNKQWVRHNWEKSYRDIVNGDIWPPGEKVYEPKFHEEHAQSKKKKKCDEYMRNRPNKELHKFPPTDQPMPFITAADDGYFNINKEALKILESGQKPVCVIAIAGKYRTGKSYLMNRLYGTNSGFPLGGAVEAKTKGIWMWQRDHPLDPTKTLVLLDTEGLYDPKKGDATHDMKLFTLAILLSSCFVFNITGVIDDAIIQQLHLVSKLTDNLKTKNSPKEETGEEFSKYFPTFIMMIRDFFLELTIGDKSCTELEYLEQTLKLKPGHDSNTRTYNEPRQCIKEFFTKRRCFVLPKPIEDDKKLRELENVAEEELKLDFLQKSDIAVKAILEEAATFQVDGDIINTRRFVQLASEYVDALNSGKVPCIESAVQMLRTKECLKAKSEAIGIYDNMMLITASAVMPLESEILSKAHRNAMDEATEVFRRRALFDEEGKYVEDFLNEVKARYLELVAQNEEESSFICRNYLALVFQEINKKIEEKCYLKEGGYELYREDVEMAEAMFNSYVNKGPMAHTALKHILKSMESTGNTILNSDKALTEAAKKLKQEQEERKEQMLIAEEQRSKNEALRLQFQDEQENNRRMLKSVKEDMEKRLSLQADQHNRHLAEKERTLQQLKKEGSKNIQKFEQQIKKLRLEKQNNEDSQQKMRHQMDEMQAENNKLLSEIRQTDANNKERMQQLQQQVHNQSRARKKKGCVVM